MKLHFTVIVLCILTLLFSSCLVLSQSTNSTTTTEISTSTSTTTTATVISPTTSTTTSSSSSSSVFVELPSVITPKSLQSQDLHPSENPTEEEELKIKILLQFTTSQFQEWLSTIRISEISGRAPPEDQPYGARAVYGQIDMKTYISLSTTSSGGGTGGATTTAAPAPAPAASATITSAQPALITFLSNRAMNLTIPAVECFVPNEDDKMIVRFSSETSAVRKYDTSTLAATDYDGSALSDVEIDILIEDEGDTPAAGLGVISFTFALICLLYLLSDWTQATVSLMQLQWIIMICMQTCVPPSTSNIVKRAHYILWPLSGNLHLSFPEYAFRILFNLLILLFILVLELLMIGAFIGVGKDRVTAMQRARFPSTLGVGLAVLLPTSCMFIATRVFSLVNIDSPVAGGVQITYAVIALLLSLIYLILVCISTFTVVSRLVFRELQPRANRSWFQRLTSPDGEWLVEPAVSARWGLLFDGYSVRGFWVFAAQQIISFVFACSAGPAPISETGCQAKSYLLMITSVILAALHFVRKPYSTALANLTNTIVSLGIVILCISVISSQTCSSRARIFTSSCAWGALLVLMIKVLLHTLLTIGTSVHRLLFANEVAGSNKNLNNFSANLDNNDDDAMYDDETAGLGGRLLSPFGGQDQEGLQLNSSPNLSMTNNNSTSKMLDLIEGGGSGQQQSIPLLNQHYYNEGGDGFELRLFSGTDATFDTPQQLQQQQMFLSSSVDDQQQNNSNQTFISLAPPSSSSSPSPSRSGAGKNNNNDQLMTVQPALGNPVLIGAGAFLKREVGFGKMGGLRGMSGPSLVIQLYAPIAVVASPTSGTVVVLEAGYRGGAMARNGSAGVVMNAASSSSQNQIDQSNNNNSSPSPMRSIAPIPRDAKPRLLAHVPNIRRVEEIVMRDISALKDALGGGGGNNNNNSFATNRSFSKSPRNSNRRAMSSSQQRLSPGSRPLSRSPRNTSLSPSNANDDTMSVNSDQTTLTDVTSTSFTQQQQQQQRRGGRKSGGSINNIIATSSSSPIKLPTAACMGQNCLFVCDADDGSVLRVDLVSGLVTTVISDLLKPSGVAILGDRLFVSDTLRHRVLAVDLLAGKVSVVAGTGSAGFDADGSGQGGGVGSGVLLATQSRLNCPQGLAVSVETGELFIADSCNHRVVCLSLSLKTMRTILGRSGHVGDTHSNGELLRATEEVVLSMPTQVLCRVAPEASNLDVSSAFAVEVFVIESGNAKIWHVNRFGFAHVILPRNGFLTPYSFCLVPSHQSQTLVQHQKSLAMSNPNVAESSSSSLTNGVELLVVDTHQQIVVRMSVPTLQAASSLSKRFQRQEVPKEFQFRSPTFERTIPSVGRNMSTAMNSAQSPQQQQQHDSSNNNIPTLTVEDTTSHLNEFQSL